jgi:uncharacterized damage-inducible protein DinB
MGLAVLAGCCLAGAQAQMAGQMAGQMGGMKTPMAPAVGSATDPAKEIDGMVSLFEKELIGAVKAMPADKYSFAPTSAMIPGSKYDGVRTFAAQVTHLIQANYGFYSRVGGMKPDVDMKAIDAMTSKDELVAALAASFVFAHKAVATITPANAFLAIKGADGMNTRATLATFGVAHGYDHYGQIVEYLRMNGIVPPASS